MGKPWSRSSARTADKRKARNAPEAHSPTFEDNWNSGEADRQKRKRRHRALERWERRPPAKRAYFSFAELADQRAGGLGHERSEKARAQVLRDLMISFRRGDFERDGKSTVRLRSSALAMQPFSRADLREIESVQGWDPTLFQSQYIEQFCVPRHVCRWWYEQNQIDLPPSWFPEIDPGHKRNEPTPAGPDLHSTSSKGQSASVPRARKSNKLGRRSLPSKPNVRATLMVLMENRGRTWLHQQPTGKIELEIRKLVSKPLPKRTALQDWIREWLAEHPVSESAGN
jgi:hypothetical protein